MPIDHDEEQNINGILLVPVVCACIHLPPPPINQILHVSYPTGAKFGQFAAVTVTGTVAVGVGREAVFLTDGTRPVDIGYRIAADSVKAFERSP